MRRWLVVFAMALFLSPALACGGDKPAAKPKATGTPVAANKAPTEPKAKPADEPKAKPADEPKVQPADEPDAAAKPADGEQKPADGPTPAEDIVLDKPTLQKAYLEAHCAQKKGETDGLLDVYKKYGFEKPEQWSKAWSKAAKDPEFVAKLTQAAKEACP